MRAAWDFLRNGLTNFDQTASLIPSSPQLVAAMLRPLPPNARCVVELGSGTGTLTRKILERLAPDGHVHALELDQPMLDTSVARIGDPRMRPVHGNAVDMRGLIGPACVGNVDAVVSSLGLSLMNQEDREAMVNAAREVMRPGGVFSQYAYLHARWFAYSQARRRWFRWYARPFLESAFDRVESEFVPVNVPPAVVYTCTQNSPNGRSG